MLTNDVSNNIITAKYVFAKSMPWFPHEYTLRKTWNDGFDECVLYIREYGNKEKFGKKAYTYLYINGWKYWTMGDPVEETILINRAKVNYETYYDQIAGVYDQWFLNEEDQAEEIEIIDKLEIKGKVLDIGCGTGMLLNHVVIPDYIGIDPSQRMLDRFSIHHPDYEVIRTTFEDYSGDAFDTIVSLFGSPSYVVPNAFDDIRDHLNPGGKAYLMFYSPDYEVFTHEKAGLNIPYYELKYYPEGDEEFIFNNYTVRVYNG